MLIALAATDADALDNHERPDWLFGIGWGMGRGAFDGPDLASDAYRTGASPHIRLGRMVGGKRIMIGAHWQSWLIEFGDSPTKFRQTLQNFALGVTVFPGDPNSASGGIFLRGGLGIGLVGLAEKDAIEGEKQHGGTREDEWGVGYFVEGGYEFWITHRFSAGLGLTYNYFSINETLVDTAWFTATIVHMNLYF